MSLNAIQQQGLEQIGERLILAFKKELAAQDHKASGSLIDSFAKKVTLTIEGGELVISMNDYGRWVDTGRRKGAKGVPIFALMDWIITKGIESDITKVKGVAFAIQKTIIKEGIPTRGSLALNSPKTDFINRGYNNIKSDVEKSMNEIIGTSMRASIENLVRETSTKMNQ